MERSTIRSVLALGVLLLVAILVMLGLGRSVERMRDAGRERETVVSDPSSPPETVSNPLTLLTWNVHAGRRHFDGRLPVVLDVLEVSDADLILLQEVDVPFRERLRGEPWVRDGYEGFRIDGEPASPGGLYLLSRHPIRVAEVVTLPGSLGRVALLACVEVAGTPLVVANCHLESPLKSGPVRVAQIDRIQDAIGAAADAIFVGDFNFGDGEQPESDRLDLSFIDVWSLLRSDEPGFTWDNDRNPLARAGAFPGEPSRRLDRIRVRSAAWEPSGIHLVGTEPIDSIEPPLHPSDHFGVRAVLARTGPVRLRE